MGTPRAVINGPGALPGMKNYHQNADGKPPARTERDAHVTGRERRYGTICRAPDVYAPRHHGSQPAVRFAVDTVVRAPRGGVARR